MILKNNNLDTFWDHLGEKHINNNDFMDFVTKNA